MLFLRAPTSLTLNEFFTEDGSTFFRDQLLLGPAGVFQPYHQYLLVIPRLCAVIAARLPIIWVPRAYAIEALLIAGICCSAFALEEFRPILSSDRQRLLLCLISAIALPAQEMIGSLAHLPWFLTTLAVPLTLLPAKRRSTIARTALATLGAAIGLSGPLPIIFVPPIAVYGFRRGRLTEFQLGILIGALIEWAVVARNWIPQPATFAGFAGLDRFLFSVLVACANQIGLLSLFGRRPAIAVWAHHYGGMSLLLLLLLVSLQVALSARGDRAYRTKVIPLVWLILASVALSILRGMPYPEMSVVQPFGAHRYFYLACWCFALLIVLAVEAYIPNWPLQRRCGLVLLIFLFAGIENFRLTPRVRSGWEKFIPEIQAWKADLDTGRRHAAFSVPSNPPGWLIQFPKIQDGKAQP